MAESSEETFKEKWTRLANLVSEKHNADVILCSGDIDDTLADQLISIAKNRNLKKNVILMLTTRGGSPDAAFRMARCLQRKYTEIILFIYGTCKSAGTLISIAANKIILSDFGEFGPLDIQLGKRDEFFERVSGLNITQALVSLDTRALNLFRRILVDVKGGSRSQVSTKLAAEIGSNLASGLYGTIYAQIDPSQLGSIERSIAIASDYGEQLKTENVKDGTIDKLVTGYSSHSFVIDIKEAQTLFNDVKEPDENEEELAECFYWVTRDTSTTSDKPCISKLNTTKEEIKNERTTDETSLPSAGEKGKGSEENNAATSGTEETKGAKRVKSIK